MSLLLEAQDLHKSFGGLRAVDGISLQLKQGEVLGFLGPNGAGKTTTMKMLTGFLAPTSGSASICGEQVTTGNVDARKNIGYLPEGAPLYGEMTTRDFLLFVAQTHGLKGKDAAERVEEASVAVHLEGVMGQKIETLSKGFKRRVGLAAAIMHAPDVLILDEPTDGLDPNQKHDVRRLIKAMAKDRAIIISTHILEEVEALCTRAIIINKGRIVADDVPSKLKEKSRYAGAVSMLVEAEEVAIIQAGLKTISGIQDIETASEGQGVRVTAIPKRGVAIADAVAGIADKEGWHISQFAIDAGRLDDVFRQLTAGGRA
ncbi:ABC transporter ATP-binding protein [Kordiimonas sediminis]|uniref:ABC transporter ATP-binding protein n=1 Tax=Kordiimonas sediminis TaxID=1735581 RepID=A0A919AJH8_9PROT|nr:ABC transporter ATP-binding protein [Kordiimonas sediminis]GHF10744.1 ABC transporter ATP-binding protein [Kordiimonas sediminis]